MKFGSNEFMKHYQLINYDNEEKVFLNVRVTEEQRQAIKETAIHDKLKMQDLIVTLLNLGLYEYYNQKKEGIEPKDIVKTMKNAYTSYENLSEKD